MKNFIKTLFAVILGNAIFFGIFFFIFVLMIIGLVVSSRDYAKENAFSLSSNTSLVIDLNNPLAEKPESSGTFYFGSDNRPINIYQLIDAIKIAKTDPDVKSILIKMNGNASMSYAQTDLIRNALKDFKDSKKPVIAYGEVVSQKSYYMSTVADKIYVNPNGGMDISGFGAQLMFYKDLLDDLQIEPQIFYAGKFKSATEPLRLDHMSEENKIQTKELLQDVSNIVVRNIAVDRKMSDAEVNESINMMKSSMPQEAQEAKLIDGMKYYDEVQDEMKKEIKVGKDVEVSWLKIERYAREKTSFKSSGGIAVYVAEGDIVDGKSDIDGTAIGSETMVRDINKLAKNKSVKGVVIRINSPGGSALASSVMLRAIHNLRKVKPVVVSMGDVAASGGYYISCEADKVFAEPNTITGSIGVFGIIPNFGKMFKNKLGITFDEVELNDHAVMGVTKPLDELEKDKITKEIVNTYNTFKSVVSNGRKLSMDSVETIAQGRVWSGTRAKEIGLVNEIGTLHDAIKFLSDSVDVEKDDFYFYNKSISDIDRIMADVTYESIMLKIKTAFLKSTLKDYYSYFQSFYNYSQRKGVQARMYYEIKM